MSPLSMSHSHLPIIHHTLQKIQCTFKIDIEGMGHLAGGDEKDVSAD